MTSTPPEAPTGASAPGPDSGPRATRDEMKDLGRLRRSTHDRKVAGVAGGLARHLDIDPLVLRVAFVVLAFFGGAGLILYGACWLLVPDEETNEAPVTLDERSRTVALLVVGALAVFALVGDSWGYFWFPWPLAIIALIVFVILNRKDKPEMPAQSYTGYQPHQGYPGYQSPPTYGASRTGWVPPTDPAAPGDEAADETQTQVAPPTQDYSWTPPPAPTYSYNYAAPPRNPRKRGPKLFWFTIALVTLGLGLLGTADVAGVPVTDSAYPALAVGIIGVMLLVGAFIGRAGGLIFLGLIAAVGLAGATAADNVEFDTAVRHTPLSAAEVESTYDFGASEIKLDLRQVADVENLDGRTISIEGGLGDIEVIVPDDVTVVVDAEVGGPGAVELFGVSSDGIATTRHVRHVAFPGAPVLTIDAQLGVGEIHVDEE